LVVGVVVVVVVVVVMMMMMMMMMALSPQRIFSIWEKHHKLHNNFGTLKTDKYISICGAIIFSPSLHHKITHNQMMTQKNQHFYPKHNSLGSEGREVLSKAQVLFPHG
jgi:hypothetical protein